MFKTAEEALEYNWLAKQMITAFSLGTDKHGKKVVDFSEVPSDVLPVVTGVFARLLYDVQFWMQPINELRSYLYAMKLIFIYLPMRC